MKVYMIDEMKKMGMNPFTLTFRNSMEARFLHFYRLITLRDGRLAWFAGIFLYALFGFHDIFYFPENRWTLLTIRFLMVMPSLGIILGLTYTKNAYRFGQALIAAAILICGLGLIFSTSFMPVNHQTTPIPGLILVFMFAFAFTRARFLVATASVLLLLIAFDLHAFLFNRNSASEVMECNFYLVAAIMLGFTASYMIEFFERRNFYFTHLLKQEKQLTENANLLLEKRIHERTEILNLINKHLHDEIQQKSRIEDELLVAKEEAEKANRMKSMYLANMSHEIRSPMNGILGFAQLLKQNNLSEEKRNEFVDIINDNGKLLLNLIEDIIDLAKIEAGQLKLNFSLFSVADMLTRMHQTYSLNKSLRRKDKVDLRLRLPEVADQIRLFSDEKRIEQVISNLLDNALKFTESGYVELGLLKKEGKLIFYVKDSGIGLDGNQLEGIFNRFDQGGISTIKYGGAGLGLTICKGIAELLHGSMQVESEPDMGSTFSMAIPLESSARGIMDDKGSEAATAAHPWLGKTVLVAEDEEVNYVLISEILKETQVSIIHARNGLEALKIVNDPETPVDLVLMDIKMPEMNGYETISSIRKVNREIPIIAQSAYAMNEEIAKCLNLGCNDYITKPIDSGSFISCLGKYLN